MTLMHPQPAHAQVAEAEELEADMLNNQAHTLLKVPCLGLVRVSGTKRRRFWDRLGLVRVSSTLRRRFWGLGFRALDVGFRP